MVCAACGSALADGARFCSVCGRPVQAPVSEGPRRQLVRPRVGRKIAGVCAGIAQYTGWDLTMIRLAAVLALVFGVGTPLLGYVVAWIVIPDGPYGEPVQTTGPGATL